MKLLTIEYYNNFICYCVFLSNLLTYNKPVELNTKSCSYIFLIIEASCFIYYKM